MALRRSLTTYGYLFTHRKWGSPTPDACNTISVQGANLADVRSVRKPPDHVQDGTIPVLDHRHDPIREPEGLRPAAEAAAEIQ